MTRHRKNKNGYWIGNNFYWNTPEDSYSHWTDRVFSFGVVGLIVAIGVVLTAMGII